MNLKQSHRNYPKWNYLKRKEAEREMNKASMGCGTTLGGLIYG